MPYFVIHALDRPGALSLRLEHYPAHRAYLGGSDAMGVTIAASGPLLSEDDETMIGSCFVIEAEDIAKVRAFNAADPFAKAGLWEAVRIHRFDVRRGSVGSPR